MKTTKKLLALLLALSMLFALGLTAAADDPDGSKGVAGIENPTVSVGNIAVGDTVRAYKLISYDADYNSYVYYEDFGKALNNYRHTQNETLDDVMVRMSEDEVAAVLGQYAGEVQAGHPSCTLPAPTAAETAGEGGKVSLTLEPGYYLLLVETLVENSKIYNPMSIFVRVKDGKLSVYGGGALLNGDEPAMNAKSAAAPQIAKRVSDNSGVGAEWKTTAATPVGETLSFYVRVEVPKFTGITDMSTLKLTDTLDGVKYVDGSAKVYRAESGNIFAVEVTDALTETVGNYEDGAQTVDFALNYGKLLSTVGTVDVYVRYQAVVMPDAAKILRTVDAAAGTSEQFAANGVKLTYASNLEPENEKSTAVAETKIYNYAFELKKYSTEVTPEGELIPVAGAGFTVYTDKTAKTPLKFVLDGAYYRPALPTETEGVVTEITAPCVVRGLDIGTYYLTESTVPSGYYAPKGDFKLELNARRDAASTLTGRLEAGQISNEDDADRLLINGSSINALELNRYDFGLKNSSTPILPTTGGVGTALFTVAGVALMAAAVWLFFLRRRKNSEE